VLLLEPVLTIKHLSVSAAVQNGSPQIVLEMPVAVLPEIAGAGI
jgi:hypothetical protein